MSTRLSDPHALRLLRSMIGGQLPVISPKIGMDVTYPRVEEVARISSDRASELIHDLWEQGYLERRFSTTVYRCPHDRTTSLRPRLYCPSCQSEDIERVPLIEHMICGHIDIERNFKKGEDLQCPKCGRKLNQIGVDYRRPGFAYSCPSCGEFHPAPLEKWSCNFADHIFQIEDAIPEKLYSYTLNEEGKGEILRIFEYIQPIKEVYEKCGFEAESFHQVTGTSGVSHLVDVYAETNSMNPIKSITKVLTDGGIKPEEVLKHYAISLDIKASKTILIAHPKLDRESEVYSQNLGLMVIEGEDFDEILQKLASQVCQW